MAKAKSQSKTKPKSKPKTTPTTTSKTTPKPKGGAKKPTPAPAPTPTPAPKGKGKGKPPKLPVEAVPIRLILLGAEALQTYEPGDDVVIGPPTLFAVEPMAPLTKRYLYLLQKETDPEPPTLYIVLLQIIDTHEAAITRVPPIGAWQRAIVTGTVHLLASNSQLSRADLVAIIGGHEPPPTQAKPPYT